MDVPFQFRAGPKPRKRADNGAGGDLGLIDMAERLYLDIVGDRHTRAEKHVGADDDIATDLRIGRQPDCFGVGHGHAARHRPVPETRLHGGLRLGKLGAAVHAHDLDRIGGLDHGAAQAAVACKGDDIGQVVFAVCVIVADRVEQRKQVFAVDRHDPRVAQPDFALGVIRVLEFDDGFEPAILRRHEAPVFGRVVRPETEHDNRRVIRGAARSQHVLHGFGGEQRGIAE